MAQKLRILKFALALCTSILIMIIFVIFCENIFPYHYEDHDIQLLDKGWSLDYRNQSYQDITLSNFKLDPPDDGDEMVLSTRLPVEGVSDATVSFLVYHSVVTAYLDGQQFYSYGKEEAAKNELVGSGYQYILLPADYYGKELTIQLDITEKDAFSDFTPILLGQGTNLYGNFIHSNRFVIFASVFLVVIGLVFLAISSFMIYFVKHSVRLTYISIFSILIGIWTGCNYKIIQLLSDNLPLNTLIEYIALYLMPLFIALLFYTIRSNQKREKIIYLCFIGVDLVFAVTVFTLQFLNLVHIPRVLTICHVIVLAEVLYCLYSIIRNLKNEKRSEKLLLVGLLFLSVFVIGDLIVYNLQKYNPGQFKSGYVSITPVGAVAFVIFLLISYLIEIYDSNNEQKEKEYFMKLAYCDYLTQTGNRAKCNEVLSELRHEKTSYGIINLDLNGLKTVNDTRGHNYGDLLISGLANVLKRCFEPYGMVGRMGGDEFIIILKNITKENLEEYLRQFQHYLNVENENNLETNISVSYGYAMDSEVFDRDPLKVYNLADARMYQMKEIFHKAGQGWQREQKNESDGLDCN